MFAFMHAEEAKSRRVTRRARPTAPRPCFLAVEAYAPYTDRYADLGALKPVSGAGR